MRWVQKSLRNAVHPPGGTVPREWQVVEERRASKGSPGGPADPKWAGLRCEELGRDYTSNPWWESCPPARVGFGPERTVLERRGKKGVGRSGAGGRGQKGRGEGISHEVNENG